MSSKLSLPLFPFPHFFKIAQFLQILRKNSPKPFFLNSFPGKISSASSPRSSALLPPFP